MNWNSDSAQLLKTQLSPDARKVVDYLAENHDQKFTPGELVEALTLKSEESLRSYLGKTTIGAKRVGVSQEEPHSWFVLWENKPEWLYWLDSIRAGWWLHGSGWTDEELRGAVEDYLEMLQIYRRGEPFIKKQRFEALSRRFGRTRKSFEYRAQNISYVLDLLGRQWLPGLKPAKNVGTGIAGRIEELIAEAEGREASGHAKFAVEVRTEQKKKKLEKPIGDPNPATKSASSTVYLRDSRVVAWVLAVAGDTCEACGIQAPFERSDGTPYLEVHHVQQLADGGPDVVENAVGLCPNCHRALHYSSARNKLANALYQRVGRLK